MTRDETEFMDMEEGLCGGVYIWASVIPFHRCVPPSLDRKQLSLRHYSQFYQKTAFFYFLMTPRCWFQLSQLCTLRFFCNAQHIQEQHGKCIFSTWMDTSYMQTTKKKKKMTGVGSAHIHSHMDNRDDMCVCGRCICVNRQSFTA